MREITIRSVLNGFIVRVGCQELVFTSMETITKELIRYQADPGAVEKEYLEHAVNKMKVPAGSGGYGTPIREEEGIKDRQQETCLGTIPTGLNSLRR